MKKICPILLLSPIIAAAQDIPVKFGGFVDSYYAYDFETPSNHEREFTTQPVRHDEFNLNLAYVDAVIKRERTRGRFALQYGNSVTKNTLGEPRLGTTSGPDDMKHIQEAYLGKKVGEKTWIDVGIFLGNIGAESWISKDNWTYSRAMNLDYVPYYSSGVRLEHQLNSRESIQLQLLNGWQNMSENNNSKAFGGQYKNLLSDSLTFTYNNFFGDEQVVPNPRTMKYNSRFRGYHNFILQFLASDKWNFLSALDIGHQAQQNNNGVDIWGATTFTVRRILNSTDAIAVRGEYYNDRHQANIYTGTRNGFEVISISSNFDKKLDDNSLWRTEIRGFHSRDRIYPKKVASKSNVDAFIATSMSFWF